MNGGLTVVPLPSGRRFGPGDDLVAAVDEALAEAGVSLADGDVLCVASKAVSKVEGAFVEIPGDADRRAAAAGEAARIVADAPWVLITQTRHGFVCANNGIDASNTERLLRLPDDPDASAARLRGALERRHGVRVGVVVTDTFGRPWRLGQTDVAVGAAGVRAIRDERGRRDLLGRPLEVTEAAVADELAGAADLVRTKDAGVPFVLVRGADVAGRDTARSLVRPAADDVFRHGEPTATEAALARRRTVRRFADAPVDDELVGRAVALAATAPAPHHTRPWRFLRLADDTRGRLLDAMTERWRLDLAADGVEPERVERRIARSDAILRTAPVLLVPFVVTDGAHRYPDLRRAGAERDMFLLSGGAALQNLQVALAAHGLGAAWISSTLFCAPTVRSTLDLDEAWHPLGMIAVGRPHPDVEPRTRPPVDVGALMFVR